MTHFDLDTTGIYLGHNPYSWDIYIFVYTHTYMCIYIYIAGIQICLFQDKSTALKVRGSSQAAKHLRHGKAFIDVLLGVFWLEAHHVGRGQGQPHSGDVTIHSDLKEYSKLK